MTIRRRITTGSIVRYNRSSAVVAQLPSYDENAIGHVLYIEEVTQNGVCLFRAKVHWIQRDCIIGCNVAHLEKIGSVNQNPPPRE